MVRNWTDIFDQWKKGCQKQSEKEINTEKDKEKEWPMKKRKRIVLRPIVWLELPLKSTEIDDAGEIVNMLTISFSACAIPACEKAISFFQRQAPRNRDDQLSSVALLPWLVALRFGYYSYCYYLSNDNIGETEKQWQDLIQKNCNKSTTILLINKEWVNLTSKEEKGLLYSAKRVRRQ